ncbi:DUF3105 domain-containing protein [Streptomyces hoynatensis]|uniref:DUF3105 domain-containing protein n=1 Tax=Streptomyces hoynatensis TaxID=1141874 RepID=A0A3A9Z7M2_9ACTN|nr:DUF3105 domain-containing protein [Streptomyces hoynatensis]RKN43864.1 DUF3105 domain-containing protein [Streptomyces hoynatensis]
MTEKKTKKAALADRRAKIEEARRKERARERRARLLTITAIVVIVAAIVGGAAFAIARSGDDEPSAKEGSEGAVEGEQTWDDLSRNHVQTDVDYPMDPPAGGDHNPVWMNCDGDVYEEEIPDENAVHSLEHGAVWVTYNDEATEADIQTLSDRVSSTTYSLMSPNPDQDSPIVLTAWGHQLPLQEASDPRVATFFETYVQGEQTPEPGAACTGGRAE